MAKGEVVPSLAWSIILQHVSMNPNRIYQLKVVVISPEGFLMQEYHKIHHFNIHRAVCPYCSTLCFNKKRIVPIFSLGTAASGVNIC